MKRTARIKQFVALARVSSREQEREGFSLDVQVEAFERFAENAGGQILKLFRIAETATRREERKTFQDFIAFAKKHAHKLDGILFYKIDRAARNIFDYADLERLESEYNLPFIAISQQTENTPAGRMMRRTLAMMASFFTEQQAVDIKEGLARRVKEGWFSCKPPYGYKSIRLENGRSINDLEPEQAENVGRICEIASGESWTLQAISDQLLAEGRIYRPGKPRFHLSKIHTILTNPAYCGLIPYKGALYEGKYPAIITKATFDRIQEIMGRKANPHLAELKPYLYRGLFTCGECGCTMTIETQKGHHYLRCTRKVKRDCRNPYVREESVSEQITDALRRVALPPVDADWMFAELERGEREGSREQSIILGRIEASLVEIDKKMERLADLYMAEGVKLDEYTTLRNRLVSERHRLAEQRTNLERNPLGRLEPLKNLIADSKKAGFLTNGGTPEERRDLFKKTGSNRSILNRELNWQPRGAWQLVRETLEKQGCPVHNNTAARASRAAVCLGQTSLASSFPVKWSVPGSNR